MTILRKGKVDTSLWQSWTKLLVSHTKAISSSGCCPQALIEHKSNRPNVCTLYIDNFTIFPQGREGSVAWKNTTFVFWCVVSQKYIDSTKTVLVCFPKISHFALKDPQLINIWTRATLASPYSTFSQYCIRCSPGCFATASTLPVITSSCSPTLPEQEYSPSTIKASGESTISYTTSSWVADEIQKTACLLPPVLSITRGLHKSRRNKHLIWALSLASGYPQSIAKPHQLNTKEATGISIVLSLQAAKVLLSYMAAVWCANTDPILSQVGYFHSDSYLRLRPSFRHQYKATRVL